MFLLGLLNLFRKIDDMFYQLHPYETPFRFVLGRNTSYLKKSFKPYNPNPQHLKKVSDTAQSLLLELTKLKVDTSLLKPRESKAIAQVKHFLAHSFGNPYDFDYYTGKWFLTTLSTAWTSLLSPPPHPSPLINHQSWSCMYLSITCMIIQILNHCWQRNPESHLWLYLSYSFRYVTSFESILPVNIRPELEHSLEFYGEILSPGSFIPNNSGLIALIARV